MENVSGKLELSPWKLHRIPNTTVYSSPGFLSPITQLERRKSGRSFSIGEQLDDERSSKVNDAPVEKFKEVFRSKTGNDSGKSEFSPWKLHRTPNTTVYSSPGFRPPIPQSERRKSGRSISSSEQLDDSFVKDVPVEYLKEITRPTSREELRRKTKNSSGKSHRTPNTTVYNSPSFLSPAPQLEKRKSGRSFSFGELLISSFQDLSVEYNKELSSPISQEELRRRKDEILKTYKPAVEKNNYFERRTKQVDEQKPAKDNGTKHNVTGVSSKPRNRRQQQVPANRRGKEIVRFDEYDFPLREDFDFEHGGKNGGRMTFKEFKEARKFDKHGKGTKNSKESQTPKESEKKGKSIEAQVSEKKLIDESLCKPKSKPTITSVETVNISLKNLLHGNQGRP